jgi:heme-degrading monooxygenase HmoA
MLSTKYHIAQVNIARMKAPLDDPIMAEFVAALDEINALADRSPGFVWRLQSDAGNATDLRPYNDDLILFNLSVWESLEQLQAYVYSSAHTEVMRQRRQWFEKFSGMYLALWWVEAGQIPTVIAAKQRIDYFNQHGESEWAFSFKRPFPPPDEKLENFIAPPFDPCPAN